MYQDFVNIKVRENYILMTITPLHCSCSKTGKNDYGKKVVLFHQM